MKNHVFLASLLFATAVARAEEPPASDSPDLHANPAGNEAEALFQKSRALLNGDGVKKDPRKAYELMKSAADLGHADAIGGIGYFHSIGLVVEKNDREAIACFRKGAEKGSSKAMLNLAKMLLAGRGVEDANKEISAQEGLQWMSRAADRGLPEACLAYGSILYFGDHGVTKDETKAARYLKPAAEAGLPEAQNMIGIMLEMGQGMSMDAAAARDFFRRAALAGDAKAQSNLGRLLGPLNDDHGAGIEALAWLIIASGQAEITASKQIEESLPGLKAGEFEEAKQKATELRKTIRKPGAR